MIGSPQVMKRISKNRFSLVLVVAWAVATFAVVCPYLCEARVAVEPTHDCCPDQASSSKQETPSDAHACCHEASYTTRESAPNGLPSFQSDAPALLASLELGAAHSLNGNSVLPNQSLQKRPLYLLKNSFRI